eukprot:TRINITY_DN2558_c0_g2_i2.p1 TRINITY_DN2558_c0_g2~~TRINITY_DN2558_c0_g2_i2.p1  ORF type:complete len:942 (-),score=225.33 TRINITY_DN2558_c0_g2_i2:98-2923(-)
MQNARARRMLDAQNEDSFPDQLARRYAQGGEDDDADAEDADDSAEADDPASRELRMQGLLPRVSDPKLWLVNCREGKERDVVMQIMHVAAGHLAQGTPLLIRSAVSQDHLKSRIYIEADKLSHVMEALKFVHGVDRKNKPRAIPLTEMRQAMTVVRRPTEKVGANAWVRIRRGLYKGDLAQVVSEGHSTLVVRLVPRIDIAALRAENERQGTPEGGPEDVDTPSSASESLKRKRPSPAQRPPQKLFSAEEINQLSGGQVQRSRDGDLTFRGQKFRDGFLLKTVSTRMLVVNPAQVRPSFDEQQLFYSAQNRDTDAHHFVPVIPRVVMDAASLVPLVFTKGDTVRVKQGDLKNLTGVIVEVSEGRAVIHPLHERLTENLQLELADLEKIFRPGDHIKVLNGENKGETGTVLNVSEKGVVVVLSDVTLRQFSVFAHDIQVSTETSCGMQSSSGVQLFDLVVISPQSVGVVIKVDNDAYKVIDNESKVVTIAASGNIRKRAGRNTCLDHNDNPVSIGDLVQVLEGPQKGKQGQVKHVFKSTVFVHSKEHILNSGIFVIKCRNAVVLGSHTPSTTNPYSGIASPRETAMQGGAAPFSSYPSGGGRGGGGGGRPHTDSHTRRIDDLVRKTVIIKSGNYKGYVGVVKSTEETTATVQLHTKPKTIVVPKSALAIQGEAGVERWFGGVGGGVSTRQIPTSFRNADIPHTPHLSLGLQTPVGGDVSAWQANEDDDNTHSALYSPYPHTNPPTHTLSHSHTHSSPSAPPPTSNFFEQYPTQFTPLQHTPDSHIIDAASPHADSPRAPATPQGVSAPNTPSLPGSPYITNPPASEAEPESFVWYLPGVQVNVLGRETRGGVIVSHHASRVYVRTSDTEVPFAVRIEDLEPVNPKKSDEVILVGNSGADAQINGKTGVLISFDGEEGIVRLHENSDVRIVPVNHILKYAKID